MGWWRVVSRSIDIARRRRLAASDGAPAGTSTHQLLCAMPHSHRDRPPFTGWTPLMLAARRGSTDCVCLLLDAGADAAARNAQGKTAADIATVNKREGVVALLHERATASQRGGPAV